MPLHAPRPRPLRPPPVLHYDFDREAEPDTTLGEHTSSVSQSAEDSRHSFERRHFSNPIGFGQAGLPWAPSDTRGPNCNLRTRTRTESNLKRSSGALGPDWTDMDGGAISPGLGLQPTGLGVVAKRRRIDTGESVAQAQRLPSLLDDMAPTIQARTTDQVRSHTLYQTQAQPCLPPQSNSYLSAYVPGYPPMLPNEQFSLPRAYQDSLASTLEWLSHTSGWS